MTSAVIILGALGTDMQLTMTLHLTVATQPTQHSVYATIAFVSTSEARSAIIVQLEFKSQSFK